MYRMKGKVTNLSKGLVLITLKICLQDIDD